MRANEFLESINDKQWKLLVSAQDKTHWSNQLIDLVQSAYKHTNLGSFVNSLNDVNRSDWLILDWDGCNEPDCAIFYRQNRPDENWIGNKIQGVGHDGLPKSKQLVIDRLRQLLQKDGWWIESSDALAKSLGYANTPAVKDATLLQAIFPNTNLQLIDQSGRYKRKLPNGSMVQEIIYGKPKVRKLNTR